MKDNHHWFLRWFIYTYLVHLVAQTIFIQVVLFWLALSDQTAAWLGNHRTFAVFTLVVHFAMYLLTECANVDRERIEEIKRKRLSDE